jgi:RNA recognition motif-containing protein
MAFLVLDNFQVLQSLPSVVEIAGVEVDLAPVEESEFYASFLTRLNTAPSSLPHERESRSVRIRGLPYKISKRQIQQFFFDFALTRSEIEIVHENLERNGNEAIVSMSNIEERDRAVKTMNNRQIKNRYIEVFPLS